MEVTAHALEALASGGGTGAMHVVNALRSATAANNADGQERALSGLAALCATNAARDAVRAGAIEAALESIIVAPADALRCLADCVRACPEATTKVTRPHVLHAVLRAAQGPGAQPSVSYAATALIAAIVADESVAQQSVLKVVEEGALVLLQSAMLRASETADVPLAVVALRAAADIAARDALPFGRSVRAEMCASGMIAAALGVFAGLYGSVLVRDASLSFITAVTRESEQNAAHFGELRGGDGIRLVLSAARRGSPRGSLLDRDRNNYDNVTPVMSAAAIAAGVSGPQPQNPVECLVPREHATELHRKTADALAQITAVPRNCGVIRSLRGVTTIVSLVAHVAHSARHVEAALRALNRCVLNSQFAARDAYHATAASAIVVAMQRHRHRASVQADAIRCLIALIELYDCHRLAACRAYAVQSVYFALTEHGRSKEIVALSCQFMLLLSPCDIISNQIRMNDLLRVVTMRRGANPDAPLVQTAASNLVEAIQFIPSDILRKVEARVVHGGGSVPSRSVVSVSDCASSGDLRSSRKPRLSWRRRASTVEQIRAPIRASGVSRISFPERRLKNNDAELAAARLRGELHHHEDDVLAGIERSPEIFLMRQTLGRTLESARRPEVDFDDGLSLDEAGLEETLASTILPDIGNALQGSFTAGSSASSEPASPPWNRWSGGAMSADNNSERALSPLPSAHNSASQGHGSQSLSGFDSSRGKGLSQYEYGHGHSNGIMASVSRGETGSL